VGVRIEGEKGFVDHFIEHSIDSQSFLAKLDALIDWRSFEKYLARHLKPGPAAAGQPPYPAVVMFKILLLQFLYNLSDEGVSSAIGDRISFIHFVGLPFNSSKPDGTTIGRFRNKLLAKGRYDHLLALFNHKLEANGLLVKQGVAVDATLIASARRPRKVIDLESVPHDRHEDESQSPAARVEEGPAPEIKTSYSDDADATWTVKGGRAVYGYKAHAAVDSEHGFIIGGHVTGANMSDTKELEAVVDECAIPEGAKVDADKGYDSEANREMLSGKKLVDGIMRKARRGKPLSDEEKKANSNISRTRWIVERSFGTIKKAQSYVRSRYLGRAKVEMEFLLHALAHNMKKAINLSAS
jgi:IS5 family transposase